MADLLLIWQLRRETPELSVDQTEELFNLDVELVSQFSLVESHLALRYRGFFVPVMR